MPKKNSVKKPVKREPLTELEQWEKKLRSLKAKRARKVDITGVEDRIKYIKGESDAQTDKEEG